MTRRSLILATALFLAGARLTTAAAGRAASRTGLAAYTVEATLFERAPLIDGKLDPAIWEAAVALENFTQYEPLEGSQPSERTVAYVGHDDKNLYVAIRCYDSDPKAIRACLTQRDKVMGDDEVSIYLDTFNDMKRAFVFQVNPCGIQSDGVYTEPTGR